MYSNTSPSQERELVLKLINDDENAFFAEDIFQDTFTIVWQSRKFINLDSSFSAYLYTIMRNRILNMLRDLEYQEQLKDILLSQAVDANDSTEERTFSKDFMEQMVQAMETPRQREIFEMSRTQELSHKEIAQTLGISVNTVQEHISTSLKIIRAYFTKHNGAYTDLLLLLFILNS